MARFFLDVINGHGAIIDEEGTQVASRAELTALIFDNIRSMVAEDARQGKIDLLGRVIVRDASGTETEAVTFSDAFELRLPGGGMS